MSERPHDDADAPVGLIGLGLMGSAMAGRWLAAGHRVIGWDLEPLRVEALRAHGVEPAGGAAAVVAACPRVVLSLPTYAASAEVVGQAAGAWRPGQLVLDTTTGDPDQAEALGLELGRLGVDYLDATVSGSSAQVSAGEVTVMVGGPPEGFARGRDLLDAFARRVAHLGPCGSGSKLKLVSNLVLGLNRAALAEGLALAGALGLDPDATLGVLRDSMAYARIMDTKGPKMVAGDFTPQARLSQHRKDVGLILAAAERAGLDLPLSRAHDGLLSRAEDAGLGELDNSAILRAYGPDSPRGLARDDH